MTMPLPEQSDASALPRNLREDPPVRYCLEIAYDGWAFHGWQKQEPPDQPPLRTVQAVVESTLRHLLKQPVIVRGASRTDTGVHALGQRAQFDARPVIPLERLGNALNGKLPDDVAVRQIHIVPDDFDVIRDVVSKQYCYTIHNTMDKPLGLRHLVYNCWAPLDIQRMDQAARGLVGEHDFAGFAAASHGRTTTVRTIYHCEVRRHPGQPQQIQIVVQGSGFLYHMVRIIAGTLVEIGRGRFEPERICAVLASADRALAGPTLPPQGLCLEWIRYREGSMGV